jgi:flagellar motor protein MotB
MNDNSLIVRTPTEDVQSSTSLVLFLPLFLLILAFFILLVAISTVEEVKSSAVMNSLTSTFSKTQTNVNDPTEYTAKDGSPLSGHQFQEQLTNLFATTLQVAKVEIVRPGSFMRVAIPTETMFAQDVTELRPVVIPIFDRIVATLSGRSPGIHFEMEFVLGVDYTQAGELPIGQTLAMSRASSVAEELAGRGVPPDAISIGLREGNLDTVTINFYVRNEQERQFQYLQSGELPVQSEGDG